MSTVYPAILGFAGYGDGHDAFLHPDDEWDDSHPLVQERPDLFTAAPLIVLDDAPAPKRRGRPPKSPVSTEPGCLHQDCVLAHPHAGPTVLAGVDG